MKHRVGSNIKTSNIKTKLSKEAMLTKRGITITEKITELNKIDKLSSTQVTSYKNKNQQISV